MRGPRVVAMIATVPMVRRTGAASLEKADFDMIMLGRKSVSGGRKNLY